MSYVVKYPFNFSNHLLITHFPSSHSRPEQTTLKTWSKHMENLLIWKYNYWIQLKTLWPKDKLFIMSTPFCVKWQCIQKSSAADAYCRCEIEIDKLYTYISWYHNLRLNQFNKNVLHPNIIHVPAKLRAQFMAPMRCISRSCSKTLSHIQQIWNEQLWKHSDTNLKNLHKR